jgi:hypothetical protein
MLILLAHLGPSTTPATAGEDVRDIQLYQKTQGKRDWEDYKRWKRNQDDADWRDREDRRPTMGSCKGWYEAQGQKMWTKFLAEREARKAWERVARSKVSEEYADWNYAGGKRNGGFRCWGVGSFTRCEARAMACRPS